MAREKTRFDGVYKRLSKRRRHQGKPDVCFDITYKDARGKKLWEKVGFISEGYTAAKASRIRGERMQQMRHGGMQAVRRDLTFGEAWERYDANHLATRANPEYERQRYESNVKDRLAHLKLNQITPLILEEMKGELLQRLSPGSVIKVFGLIRGVYRKAIDWGLWQGEPPTTRVSMPKADASRVRFLSPEEARRLMNELKARSDQLWRIAMVSLHTGFRAGEVFGLMGEHVDMANGMLRAVDTKNGTSRTVKMTDTLKAEVFETMAETPPGQYVFPSRSGGRIKSVSKAFSRSVDALGLNEGVEDKRFNVVFHTLRHTFASWLASDGVPLYVVGSLLGHKSMEMTQRYSHLCPDVRQQAVANIDKRFTDS